MADTGWLTASSFSIVSNGDDSWVNGSYVYNSDNNRTESNIRAQRYSHTLRVTGFSAEIPAGSSNIRLEVKIERNGEFSAIFDDKIRFFNGTNEVGANKAAPLNWPSADDYAFYGGSADDWNAGITLAQANSLNSGIAVRAYNDSKNNRREARIDQVQIKYYYDAPQGTTYQVEATATGSNSATLFAKVKRGAICDASGLGNAFVAAKQADSADGNGWGFLLSVKHEGMVHRYSVKDQALATQWHGVVKHVDPVKLSLPTRHGGFLQVFAGQIRFVPSAFGGVEAWSIDSWPPPKELDAVFRFKSGDQKGVTKLFKGKFYRESVAERDVVYDVYIPSYTEVIGAGTLLSTWSSTGGTLINFFEKVCEVLGLTLDNSKATASPPMLSHTLSSERLVIDVASEVAAFCCHLFWIADGTLYLQDMSVDNGSLSLKNPNDFFRSPTYTDEIPINRVIAGAYKFEGTEYPYGVDYTLSANYTGDDSQLQGIYELVNGQWGEVPMPVATGCGEFVPGKQVTLHDARLAVPSETIINMRAVSYDFINSSVKIAGHCLMNEL